MQSKPTSKSKASPDTKRGLVMIEETGNARRKIKKKEGMQNVGDDVEDVGESATEVVVEMTETTSVSDIEDGTTVNASISLQERTVNKQESSENCLGGGNGDSGNSGGNVDSSANIIRTGLPLLAEAVVSLKDVPSRTLNSDSIRSDRGLEETLDTDEICLTKAVIEEIIPDYGNDSSCVSSSVGSEVNSRNTQSTGQMFRNLEDVLGHSYSKLGKDCDVQDEAVGEPGSPVESYPGNIQTNCDTEEVGTESKALEMEAESGESVETWDLRAHSHGEGKVEEVSEEGDQNTTDLCEAQLDIRLESESGNAEVTRDESEVESGEESARNPREDKNDAANFENTGQAENESSITPDCLKSDSLPIEHTDSENSKADVTEVVEEEEEDHVSLSVALAQLIDSGCGEAEGTETLTIHSVSPGVQPEQEERREVMALEVNSRGVCLCICNMCVCVFT